MVLITRNAFPILFVFTPPAVFHASSVRFRRGSQRAYRTPTHFVYVLSKILCVNSTFIEKHLSQMIFLTSRWLFAAGLAATDQKKYSCQVSNANAFKLTNRLSQTHREPLTKLSFSLTEATGNMRTKAYINLLQFQRHINTILNTSSDISWHSLSHR